MLDALPPDVLEHIAYFAGTHKLLGPPSDLVSLVALCRSTSATLRRSTNSHLYARVFAAKFDLTAPRRRLAQLYGVNTRSVLSMNAIADELVRRFTVLKQLRVELYARSAHNETSDESAIDSSTPNREANMRLDEILWTAFLMVLEDEGRNIAQLLHARVEAWLAVFWFDSRGASGAVHTLSNDQWPLVPAYSTDSKVKIRHALGMWLFWFFLDPVAYVANADLHRRAERILRLVALNASLYPLSHLPWTSFNPEPSHIHFGAPGRPSTDPFDPSIISSTYDQQRSSEDWSFTYFSRPLPKLMPLPSTVPAILATLALDARSRRNADTLDGGLDLLELLGPSLGAMFTALPERSTAVGTQRTRVSSLVQGRPNEDADETHMTRTADIESEPPSCTDSYRWESEWARCVYGAGENGMLLGVSGARNPCINDAGFGNTILKTDERKYKTYQPGSLEGSWEGSFTYTEFQSFAALLAGAPPSKLQDCLIASHSQTWRIREYHLLAPQVSAGGLDLGQSNASGNRKMPVPLPVGDAVAAHIPEGTTVEDDHSRLRITLPSSFSPAPSTSASAGAELLPRVYTYQRYRGPILDDYRKDVDEGSRSEFVEEQALDKVYASRVLDILLTGVGHSGWGEFRLTGRVRPADGFISLLKEYTNGERGRWLYRGYLVGAGSRIFEDLDEGENKEYKEGVVGSTKGYMVGRWRDILTPPQTHGYEGAFAMARRR